MSLRPVVGLALCSIIAFAAPAAAAVSLPQVFRDHCVLQRDQPLPIWGWADPGDKIVVEIAGRRAKATAGADGAWRVTLEPLPAGGPHTLLVRGRDQVTVEDVLIGEVWIAVGQSNMMMQLSQTNQGAEALTRAASYPRMRLAHQIGGILQDAPATDVPVPWGAPHQGSSAVSFFFAEELYHHLDDKVPVGVMTFTEIKPAQSWCDPAVMAEDPVLKGELAVDFFSCGKLFNGVVRPLAPMALRGALYYQGEMNAGGVTFGKALPAVIASWRRAWGRDDLPFLFVQLASFQEHRAQADKRLDMDAASLAALHREGAEHGFVGIREAQNATYRSVPGTGMAVAIDIGEAWDIHPQDKRTVGQRLFLQARRVAYGDKKVVADGPIATEVSWKGAEAIVSFTGIGGGLAGRGGVLEGFELAGSDRVLHDAEARIVGKTVVLRCAAVEQPRMVRYAWAGFPRATLYNREGLPAAPFRFSASAE